MVVSRHRPRDLNLCLTALRQQYYPNFEIVAVVDGESASGLEQFEGLKLQVFDEPNISVARNIGISLAGGEIVAFIDDDATAEPTWLDYLVHPFEDEDVVASGGYVIGRNGISLQWGALSMDDEGWTHPIHMPSDDSAVFLTDGNGFAIRTQGTNMAFRRTELIRLGGFDTSYAFFHDESDLNLRIAKSGGLTSIVPRARVHHNSSASAQRCAGRVPKSLFDIAASSAVFHRKFLDPKHWARAREELLNSEVERLDTMLTDGRVEPKRYEDLIASFHDGYADGLERRSELFDFGDGEMASFQPVIPKPTGATHLTSRFLLRRNARRNARKLAADGQVVTLVILEPTTRFHTVRFTEHGYWEQYGGTFGRSDRTQSIIQFCRFQTRAAAEVQRVSQFRNPVER